MSSTSAQKYSAKNPPRLAVSSIKPLDFDQDPISPFTLGSPAEPVFNRLQFPAVVIDENSSEINELLSRNDNANAGRL